MIISLHTPKAGGSSFKTALEEQFKKGFKGDYGDIPLNKSNEQRIADVESFRKEFGFLKRLKYKLDGVECIHGHFLPYKYSSYIDDNKVLFITWLRDPIERLGSHYHYWFRTYDSKTAAPLHKKVVEENWSFEKFCFSPEMQNVYAKFLWNFPLERFNFIGITEYLNEDFAFFAKKFLENDNLQIPKENVNEDKKDSYFHDEQMIKKLKEHHAEDYKIYEYALQKRKERLNG